jgi:hypothetical protein
VRRLVRPDRDDRQYADAQRQRDRDQRDASKDARPMPVPVGLLLRLAPPPLRLRTLPGRHMSPAPVQDRRREHVVEDLVRGARLAPGRVRGWTQNPDGAAGEKLDHRTQLALLDAGVVGEVGERVGDLRARGGHEVVEDARGQLALLGRQLRHRLVEMGAHDPRGAPEPLERLEAEHVAALRELLLPDPRHHELQVWRFDRGVVGHARRRTDAALGAVVQAQLARLHLVEYRVDQLRLDAHGRELLGSHHVELLDGLLDRGPAARPVQVAQAEVVLEQARHAPLEAIETGERVLAQRDQEVHAQVGLRDGARQLVVEASVALVARVVEEVLLELVEDHEQLPAHGLGVGGEPVGERAAVLGLRERLADEVGGGIVHRPQERLRDVRLAPVAECHRRELRHAALGLVSLRRPAQVTHHPGAEHRALADPARPVQDGQASRHQVRGDDLALRLAAEEEGGVGLGVGRQALVGRTAGGRVLLGSSGLVWPWPAGADMTLGDRSTHVPTPAPSGCLSPATSPST